MNIVPRWDIEGHELVSVHRYRNKGHYSPCNISVVTLLLHFNLTLQIAPSVTVQNSYQKVISFLQECNIKMTFLHGCCFAANLVVKTNYWSKNQLCCFTCDFQTKSNLYDVWSSVMSFFMTSSENDVSNCHTTSTFHNGNKV